jgi:hypothetical protein
MKQQTRGRRAAAIAALMGLLLQPSTPLVGASPRQTPPAPKPPAQQPATQPGAKPPAQQPAGQPAAAGGKTGAQPAAQPPVDGGWPRIHSLSNGGSILIYQPQISSWQDQKQMVAYSAVSYDEH